MKAYGQGYRTVTMTVRIPLLAKELTLNLGSL